MRQARKRKFVKAYQLGSGSEMELQLIKEGTIIIHNGGIFELFSQEAVNGSGEIAYSGDYFKVDDIDGKYYPYPNEKNWFEDNHIHLKNDEYIQLNKPLFVWETTDPLCEEVDFLINTGKLIIKENDPEHYFNAFLWGTKLSAAKDSLIIFHSIDKDTQEKIIDISFSFIQRDQFEATYDFC